MFEHYDESELLAFVEGELDQSAAERLRHRLSAEPGALEVLERMREDRAVLCATPDPTLPQDILAELEPLLARPMLMPSAADLRRRHRRGLRRSRRWMVPVAAGIALALLAGIWVAVTGLPTPRESPLVESDPPPTPGTTAVAQMPETPVDDAPWPPPGHEVHHFAPVLLADKDGGDPVAPPADPSATRLDLVVDVGNNAFVADFALLLESNDQAVAENVLLGAVRSTNAPTALVRNFSYDEARRLEREWLASPNPRLRVEANQRVAGEHRSNRGLTLRGRDFEKLADRALRQIQAGRGRDVDPSLSRRLHGPQSLVPSYARQLEFSSLGATHTITVPTRQLNEVLARLHEQGQSTVLQRLATGQGEPGIDDAVRWLSDYPRVRAALIRLQETHPDSVILLPVVIRGK